jgi:hypothetical protein
VSEAGTAYARLAAGLPPSQALLDLVPGAAATGALDAELRRAATDGLRQTRWLPAADGERRLRPDEAVAVDGADEALVEALVPLVPGLLRGVSGRRRSALSALGARQVAVADVVDALADADRAPHEWHALYDALATARATSSAPGPSCWPTAGSCAARAGCCCRTATCPTGLTCSACGSSTRSPRTLFWNASAPCARRPARCSPTRPYAPP